MYKRGLVVGRFRILHNGHLELIDTAIRNCNQLDVIIFSNDCDPIPSNYRHKWIKMLYPTVNISIFNYNTLTKDDIKDNIPRLTTRNDYDLEVMGDDYHNSDKFYKSSTPLIIRKNFSASEILKFPLGKLDSLPFIVRKYFTKNISISGSVDSGKTTLAKKLADHYNVKLVPDPARLLSEGKDSQELLHDRLSKSIFSDEVFNSKNKLETEIYKNGDLFFISDCSDIDFMVNFDIMKVPYRLNRQLNIPDFCIVVEPITNPNNFIRPRFTNAKMRYSIFRSIIQYYQANNIPHYVIENDQDMESRFIKSKNIIDNFLLYKKSTGG